MIEDVLRGEHVELTRYGRPVSVVVPHEWYEGVAALLDDLEAYEAWRERAGALRRARRAAGLAPGDRRVVHHIDGDPRNNDPANLEVIDPAAAAPKRENQ